MNISFEQPKAEECPRAIHRRRAHDLMRQSDETSDVAEQARLLRGAARLLTELAEDPALTKRS